MLMDGVSAYQFAMTYDFLSYSDGILNEMWILSSFHHHLLMKQEKNTGIRYVVQEPSKTNVLLLLQTNVGGQRNIKTFGHSLIINPNGEVLAEGDEGSAMCINATIDAHDIDEIEQVFQLKTIKEWN